MCRFSWILGASKCWSPLGLSRSVMGLLYLYLHLVWRLPVKPAVTLSLRTDKLFAIGSRKTTIKNLDQLCWPEEIPDRYWQLASSPLKFTLQLAVWPVYASKPLHYPYPSDHVKVVRQYCGSNLLELSFLIRPLACLFSVSCSMTILDIIFAYAYSGSALKFSWIYRKLLFLLQRKHSLSLLKAFCTVRSLKISFNCR